jgi:hypothetical protein
MKGLKALAPVLLVTALIASAVPSAMGAATPPPFRHYVACGTSKNAKPAHSCGRKEKKGAFFRSLVGDVTYKVCVKFPSGAQKCATPQPATKGTLYVNSITSTIPGKHVVTWYVKGKQVGSTTFQVEK